MKTIFFLRQDTYFEYVFSKKTIEYLIENADCDGKCYTPEDLFANPEKFTDTEYIFSTWFMPALNEEEIEKYLPNLKCIFYAAGTIQYFGRPYLHRGVKIFSSWRANAIPVAEYTVSQIILANKGFFKASNIHSKEDYHIADKEFRKFYGNYGAKIGIIGAGMIGKRVIRMLKNYDLEVMAFDPFLPDETALELGIKKVSLETIFSECNVVSNHLANNSETTGMLNGNLFSKMVPYATFLNTGRGAQVVESDLINVLKERHDLTAILDVTSPEPPINESELYTLDNCILTSHIAGSMGSEVHRMSEYMLNDYINYLEGKESPNLVSESMLDTMA